MDLLALQLRRASLLGSDLVVEHGAIFLSPEFPEQGFSPLVSWAEPQAWSTSPTHCDFSANLLRGQKDWEEVLRDQW